MTQHQSEDSLEEVVAKNGQAVNDLNVSIEDILKSNNSQNERINSIHIKSEEIFSTLHTWKKKQDENLKNLDTKLTSLELADVYFQEANRQFTDRVSNVEERAKKMQEESFNQQNYDEIKMQLMDLLKSVSEINKDKKKLSDRIDRVLDKEKDHDIRLEDLEGIDMSYTKNLIFQIDSKLKQLDESIQLNSENIASLNGNTYNVSEQVSNIFTTNISLTEKITGLENKSDHSFRSIEGRLTSLEDNSKYNNEKLVQIEEATYVQAEKFQHIQSLGDKMIVSEERRQQSASKSSLINYR
jgi:chromosome segregation ATPase